MDEYTNQFRAECCSVQSDEKQAAHRRGIVQGHATTRGTQEDLSFLRLDGDMCNSTRDAIERLEPLVSSGGFVYVDDYGSFRGCALAIDEYRAAHSITAPCAIAAGPHNKFQGLWWRKPR